MQGTRFAISETNPLGGASGRAAEVVPFGCFVATIRTRTSDGSMPSIVRASSISSSVGRMTGMTELTKAFVMLDFRETIV